MKLPATTSALIAFWALGLGLAGAQQWETTISRLPAPIAKAYVSSVPSGFGANLNTGWFHKAPSARKLGFNVEGGISTMATLVGSGKKTLNIQSAFVFDSSSAVHVAAGMDTTGLGPNANARRDSLVAVLRRETTTIRFQGPTILGSKHDTVKIVFSQDEVVVPVTGGGLDTVTVASDTVEVRGASGLLGNLRGVMGSLQALPLFIPQLTLGTVMGTQVTLRWLPETQTLEELGTVKVFGIGIQHNPGVWFEKPFPVDFSIGYFNQTLEVGKLMKATSWATAINVSKTYGERFVGVTPYGGLQYENTKLDFNYTYRDMEIPANEQSVSFSVNGENKVRATLGVNVRILTININTDLSVSNSITGSLGVMVGI
jgi:hypothetical protein